MFPFFSDIKFKKESDGKENIIGIFPKKNEMWQDDIDFYHSELSRLLIIPEFFGIKDIHSLNLMILYGLSIIARYYPKLWFDIEYGERSDIKSIIELYIHSVDNISFRKAIERICGSKIQLNIYGGFNSKM